MPVPSSAPPMMPLPVITTALLERRERGYLAWVAIANEVAELPLESPPIDASAHALEIHVEGFAEPLVVLAEPVGVPTTMGFPLRLKPLDESQEKALRAELFAGDSGTPATEEHEKKPAGQHQHKVSQVTTALLKKTESFPPTLSADHALALARMTGAATTTTMPSRRAPGSLQGRVLGDGRFILDKLLGGGASGEVYRAVHTALRRSVAVKVLHPTLQSSQDYTARFYGEALAASRLDHRNVLRVIDYGQEPDGLLYIVMELLEGESLQQVLDRENKLSEERIVDLVTQACAGLAHAHDAGVIHRDIKPENIVIVKGRDDDGRVTELVKVCDFGIAHWQPSKVDAASSLVPVADGSKIVGTPVYMSPEQIQNDKVDARTDVYSLGIVLYELATGHVPFLSENAGEILSAHLDQPPPPPSQVAPNMSKELEQVILKALAKDPKRRQRDARELRAELRAIVDDEWSAPSGLHRKVSIRTAALSANDFVIDTAGSLAELVDIDPRERSSAYAALGEALKGAVLGGRFKLAGDLLAWLNMRLADPGLPDADRDVAQRTLNILRDPEVARVHAMNLLDGKIERTEETLAMLRGAGPVAARALIDARRLRPPSLELRGQFVATLRGMGNPALAAITTTLETLVPLATRQDEALAEDLLHSIPDVRSDPTGDIAVRFVRLDKPSLGLTALRATTLVWGARARPLLVGVLDAQNDAFRAVALEELKKLGFVDDVVIERLARIVLGQTAAGDELKLAAAESFASASVEARPRAVAFLISRLAPAQGLMGSIRSALGPKDDTHVAVALARSLHTLEPEGSRGVLERLASSRPDLLPHLYAIMAGR